MVNPKKAPKAPSAKRKEAVNLYGHVLALAEAARPAVAAGVALFRTVHAKVSPYGTDEELLRLLTGLIMVFFGARYMGTIAAVEAFRMVGWTTTKACALRLHDNYVKAVEASAKDDAVDANKDGVPDVVQIPLEDLVKRKAPIVLKAVDPDQVSEALASLSAGAAAVVATLRVRFAKTLTLGATLGDIAAAYVREPARAALGAAIPEEYGKFVPMLVQHGTRFLGVVLAFFLRRFAAAAHSAMRGSQLLAEGLLPVLAKAGVVKTEQAADAHVRSTVQGAIAIFGFYWQVSSGFSVPFPINVVLLPLTVFEWCLMGIVSLA